MYVKKKSIIFIAAVVAAVIAVTAAVLVAGPLVSPASAGAEMPADTNERRVAFLESYGWQVDPEPIENEKVTIPYVFGDVYVNYNALQRKQGFDLSRYRGKHVVRWTYTVKNYPGVPDGVRANILVFDGRVVGGDVCTVALGGFMQGLARP